MTNNQKRLSAASAFVLALLGCGCIFKWGFASWQFLVPSVLALIPVVFLFIDACRECASCDSNDNKRYRLIMGILTLLIIAVLIASIVAQARSHSAKTPSSNNEGSTIVDADGSDDAGDGDGNADEGQDGEPTSVDAESMSDTEDAGEGAIKLADAEGASPAQLQQMRQEMSWQPDLAQDTIDELLGKYLKNHRLYPNSMPIKAKRRATIVKGNDGISTKIKSYDKNDIDLDAMTEELVREILHNPVLSYTYASYFTSKDFIAKENPEIVKYKKQRVKEYEAAKNGNEKMGNNAALVVNPDRADEKGYDKYDVAADDVEGAAYTALALLSLYTPEEVKVITSDDYATHLVDTADPLLVRSKATSKKVKKLSIIFRRRYMDDANGTIIDEFAVRVCDKGIMNVGKNVSSIGRKTNNTPVNPGTSGNDKDTSSNPPSNPQGQGDDNDRRTDDNDRSDRTGNDEDQRTGKEDKSDKSGKNKDTSSDETKKDDKGKGGKDSSSQSQATQKADKGAGKDSNSQSNATQKGDKNKGQDSSTSADPVDKPDKQKHDNPKQEGDSKSETDTRTDVNVSGVGDSNKGSGNKDENQSQSIKEEIDIPANNQVDKTKNDQAANNNGHTSIKEEIPYTDTSTGESKKDQHTSINQKPIDSKPDVADHQTETGTDNGTGSDSNAAEEVIKTGDGKVGEPE